MTPKVRTVIYPVTDLQAAKALYTRLPGTAQYTDEPYDVGFQDS